MATIKQRVAVKKISENLRKPKGKRKTLQKIMLESGYSKETSESPQILTESKSFKELLNEYIPNDVIAKKQKSLLNAVKVDFIKVPDYLSDNEVRETIEEIEGHKLRKIIKNPGKGYSTAVVWIQDSLINDKALDKIYKLKGEYAPEKQEHTITGIEIVKYGGK